MFRHCLVALAASVLASSAWGQDDTQPGGPAIIPADVRAAFSKQIERELASHGARVAMVFRAGSPAEELPEGIRYTHGAYWVHSVIATEDEREVQGYAVYNLYNGADGEPTRSYLKQDFPYDFTSTMVEPRAGIILLDREVQRRVFAVMASPTYEALHQPSYSLISNPHDRRFQNCNEFMLDVLAAGLWETDDRSRIKTNLAAHFAPSPIEAGPIRRFFAPMVDARLQTVDHPGMVRTTTFSSLSAFLLENGLAERAYEITSAPDA